MDPNDREAGDEIARADDMPQTQDGGPDEAAEGGEPDTFELELDGETHTLPAALKGAFLRQADYTRKTQELAEHRRALEAERAAVAEHRRALEAERAAVAEQGRAQDGAQADRVRLAALDHHIAELQAIDWPAFGRADPQAAQALHQRGRVWCRRARGLWPPWPTTRMVASWRRRGRRPRRWPRRGRCSRAKSRAGGRSWPAS